MSIELGRMAGCIVPDVGSELLAPEEGADDTVDGIVREVHADDAESSDGEGETVGGREMDGAEAGESVIGSPSSFMKFNTLMKSGSL